jgi:hypothetical protein
MNADVWPVCLSEPDCQEVRPLADAAAIFAEDLVNHYRADWDSCLKDVSQISSDSRKWYIRRDTGLWAFALREAKLRLEHFSKDGLITGADYCEARMQEMIFSWGWREIFNAPPAWQKFISWRKKTAPEFASKLKVWKSRSSNHKKTLARHSPVPHIKLYAQLYDRAVIPLEFCSDDYSSHLMTICAREKALLGESEAFSRENVRRWRRDLGGLKLSKHVVAKFPHPRQAKSLSLPIRDIGEKIDRGLEAGYGVVIDINAANAVGLPYDYAKELTPVGQWRTRQ